MSLYRNALILLVVFLFLDKVVSKFQSLTKEEKFTHQKLGSPLQEKPKTPPKWAKELNLVPQEETIPQGVSKTNTSKLDYSDTPESPPKPIKKENALLNNIYSHSILDVKANFDDKYDLNGDGVLDDKETQKALQDKKRYRDLVDAETKMKQGGEDDSDLLLLKTESRKNEILEPVTEAPL